MFSELCSFNLDGLGKMQILEKPGTGRLTQIFAYLKTSV